MWFRGGGVGHKVTRDWDEFLLWEGCTAQAEDPVDGTEQEELANTVQQDGSKENDEPVEEEEGDMASEAEEWEEDVERDKYEQELDRVVADEGEELDDDILAWEGYGML